MVLNTLINLIGSVWLGLELSSGPPGLELMSPVLGFRMVHLSALNAPFESSSVLDFRLVNMIYKLV